MEVMSYPYVEAFSQIVNRHVPELGALESEGLNKEFDEESGDASPSTKKLKITEEPELISSMSIPIDAPSLSFVRVSRFLLLLMMMRALMIQMTYMMTFPRTKLLLMRALVAQDQLSYLF
ncbi:hypothetical protein Hanom_Chr08g00713441 [Helianthus anomalus]